MTISFSTAIKEIVHGAPGMEALAFDEAQQLYAAMLDGGVPELELGAILTALQMKSEGIEELLGFYQSLNNRLYQLNPPFDGGRTVVLPSYYGTYNQPNLLPLLALWLRKLGVPVLMHGSLEGGSRVASAYILRELGIMPCASLAHAQQTLEKEKFSFVPTAVLSPGLATLLSLRNRLGIINTAHTLASLIDPIGGESLRVVGVNTPEMLNTISDFMLATDATGLLLHSADCEPVVDPARRPRMEFFFQGGRQTLFEAEMGPLRAVTNLPRRYDAHAMAIWTQQVLDGDLPLPLPLVNQLACCLYGAGMADDLIQAKAIVALETGSLSAA